MAPSHTPRTAFGKHDRIVASVTAQGMVADHRYTVTDWVIAPLPFGVFIKYELQPDGGGERVWVRNLHLLARHERDA